MTLIIVPATQVDRIALPAALRQAEHVHEEAKALLGLGRKKFHVAQVGQIRIRFFVHRYGFMLSQQIRLPGAYSNPEMSLKDKVSGWG